MLSGDRHPIARPRPGRNPALCGPILAGLIIDYTGSYQWGIVFVLTMGALGFAVIVPLRPR